MFKNNLSHIRKKLVDTEVTTIDIVSSRLSKMTKNYMKELDIATKDLVRYGSRKVIKGIGKSV